MRVINRQITLAARPVGLPKVSDFHLVYSPLPSPAGGEVLVRAVYLSLDRGLRERMSDAGTEAGTIGIGEVVSGGAVAFVVESLDPTFRTGDTIEGALGWQEFAVVPGRELRKIDPTLAPISTALGVLGLPGLTAFFGLLDIADPQPGETVVVSEAAGSVGMIVGQIAKIKGCRVVGVTASDALTSWLIDELGFDAAFNCKTVADCARALEESCPAGIDIYFDSEGGTVTDSVMQLINPRARISVCGQISSYNLTEPETGPRWLGQLIVNHAAVQGFRISSFAERFPEGLEQLAAWLRQGKLKYREDIAHGIEAAPQAFIRMLRGRSRGTQLVRLSEL
ncbi:MAG: NADP-dependent oxidoreductase [Candidatus Sulfomarinibacteraceae bacterium]